MKGGQSGSPQMSEPHGKRQRREGVSGSSTPRTFQCLLTELPDDLLRRIFALAAEPVRYEECEARDCRPRLKSEPLLRRASSRCLGHLLLSQKIRAALQPALKSIYELPHLHLNIHLGEVKVTEILPRILRKLKSHRGDLVTDLNISYQAVRVTKKNSSQRRRKSEEFEEEGDLSLDKQVTWDDVFRMAPWVQRLDISGGQVSPEVGKNQIVESASRLLTRLDRLILMTADSCSYLFSSAEDLREKDAEEASFTYSTTLLPHDRGECRTSSVYGPSPSVLKLALKRWMHYHGGIRRLYIDKALLGSNSLDDKFYKILTAYGRKLEMVGVMGLRDPMLSWHRLPVIRQTVSTDVLGTFFRRCPNLMGWVFEVNHLEQDPDIFLKLSGSTKPKLENLSIVQSGEKLYWAEKDYDETGYWESPDETDEDLLQNVNCQLVKFISTCPALKSFGLSGLNPFQFLTDAVIGGIVKHCPEFRELEVHHEFVLHPKHVYSIEISDVSLRALARLPKLKTLTIGGYTRITGTGLAHFFVQSKSTECQILIEPQYALPSWHRRRELFQVLVDFASTITQPKVAEALKKVQMEQPKRDIHLYLVIRTLSRDRDKKLRKMARREVPLLMSKVLQTYPTFFVKTSGLMLCAQGRDPNGWDYDPWFIDDPEVEYEDEEGDSDEEPEEEEEEESPYEYDSFSESDTEDEGEDSDAEEPQKSKPRTFRNGHFVFSTNPEHRDPFL